jgi:hypothetical protein
MQYELKAVGLWSVAKMSFVLGALFGLLVGVLLWMFAGLLQSLPFQELPGETALAPASFGMVFFMAIGYGIFSMVANTIMAGIYNILAGLLGGIDLTLAAKPLPAPAPPAQAWAAPPQQSWAPPPQQPAPPAAPPSGPPGSGPTPPAG